MKQKILLLLATAIFLIALTASTLNAQTYYKLDFSEKFNFNLNVSQGGPFTSMPTGNNVLFGNVPFHMYPWTDVVNGWLAKTGSNPIILQIPCNKSISGLNLLANTYYGQKGPNSYASVQFWHSGAKVFEKNLVGNTDIRDMYNYIWTNSINGTTTTNVFDSAQHRIDKIHIVLPSSMDIDSILVVDNGGTNFQRIFVLAATAETQEDIAQIKAKSYDTLASCSSNNNIVFHPSNSTKPYTVQLYRFGVAYGSPVITSKNITFKNLPTGSYYATAYGDGASGTSFGQSKNVSVEPVPVNLSSKNITDVKAKLNWDAVTCAGYYTIQYRVQGDLTWKKKTTKNTTPGYTLKGLTASTTYEWQVATSDSANGIVATGAYSSISTFTTASAYVEGNNGDEASLVGKGNIKDDNNSIAVFPNPASSYFTIRYSSTKTESVHAILYNLNGKVIWTSGAMNASALNGQKVTVSQFTSGLYYLKIMDAKGVIQSVIKVSIIK